MTNQETFKIAMAQSAGDLLANSAVLLLPVG